MYRAKVIILISLLTMCHNIDEINCPGNAIKYDNICIGLSYLYLNKWGSSDSIGNIDIYLTSNKMKLPINDGLPVDTTHSNKVSLYLKYIIANDIVGNYILDNDSIENGFSVVDTSNVGTFKYNSNGKYRFVSGNVTINKDNDKYEIKFGGILSNNQDISGYFRGEKSIFE